MAVNFGDTIIEGSIEPTVRVQAPVEDNSAAVFAQAMQPVAATVGSMIGSIFESNQANKRTSLLSELNNRWVDIADAVDQGQLTRQQARARIRQTFREYTANDPTLYEDINSLHAKFLTSSGMGNIIDAGTIEEQAQATITKTALEAGYTNVQDYKDHQQAAINLSNLNQRVDTMKARGNLVTETELSEARGYATQFARTGFPWVKGRIDEAMRQIEANPNAKAEIVASVNAELGEQIAQMQSLTGALQADYIIAPVQTLLTTFNDWSTNKVGNEVLTGAISNSKLKLDMMYQVNDPKLADTMARMRFLDQVGLADSHGNLLWDSESLRKLFDNANPSSPPANIVDGTNQSAMYLQNIRDAAGVAATSDDQVMVDQVAAQVNGVIDGLYTNSLGVTDPTAFREGVEFLGSPQAKEFFAKTGGVNAKYATQAQGVIKQQYEQALLPVVNARWTEEVNLLNNSGGVEFTSLDQIVEPRWNGNAVEFVPKAGYENNPMVLSHADSLNTGANSIATPLNNLINAYSALSGEDPGKVYEEQFAGRLFNAGEEDVLTETDVQVPAANTELSGNTIGEGGEVPQGVEVNSLNDLSIRDFNSEDLVGVFGKEIPPAAQEAIFSGASPAASSPDFDSFYSNIKGKANLMSSNPSKYGTDSNTREWQVDNLATIRTPGGLGAQVNVQAAPFFQGFINELEGMGYSVKKFGGYNYRNKRGGSSLSEHSFGNAIDINWDENPMGKTLVTDLPPNISQIAAKYGLSWGGDWKSNKDAMHFEWVGTAPPM